MTISKSAECARHWTLNADLDFLNHGSFGACPREVQNEQARLRGLLEAQPVAFLTRTLPPLLDAARTALAEFVGADADDLAFVANATTGVNTILAGFPLSRGDEILVTDLIYNACRNAVDKVAVRTGAEVICVTLPYPTATPAEVTGCIVDKVTPRTRMAVIDHITSPTALILPIDEIVKALQVRGVAVLIDGAHAPGMVPLGLRALGADFYTGNCHKWVCAPKGSAFLYVAAHQRESLGPLTVSHGAIIRRHGRSAYHDAFDWQGTADPTPFLSLPVALQTMAALHPRGWEGVYAHNHALALEAHALLLDALDVVPLAPVSMLGSMAVVKLPVADAKSDLANAAHSAAVATEIYEALCAERFEVPVMPSPDGSVVVRVSAQLYNHIDQYARLAQILPRILSH